jgi:hypothetical protein
MGFQMWQYGDGDLHGWVYDPTLKVVCPTDACSVLRCGFRADCVRDREKNSTRCHKWEPGANPTTSSYNASAVKSYNATSNLLRFESKNIFFYLEKSTSLLRWSWSCT